MTRITRRDGDPRTEPRLESDPARGLGMALLFCLAAVLLGGSVAVIWLGGGL